MSYIKQCTKCDFLKTVDQFYKRTARRTGYQSTCIECSKQYEVDNKEKISARKRLRRQEKKDKLTPPRNIFRRAITWLLNLIRSE